MLKLSKVVHQRLISQAEEAKELKLNNLSENVLSVVGPVPRDENEEQEKILYADLEKEIDKGLWKIAVQIIAYHNAKSADIQKIEEVLGSFKQNILAEVEELLSADLAKLPGQVK